MCGIKSEIDPETHWWKASLLTIVQATERCYGFVKCLVIQANVDIGYHELQRQIDIRG